MRTPVTGVRQGYSASHVQTARSIGRRGLFGLDYFAFGVALAVAAPQLAQCRAYFRGQKLMRSLAEVEQAARSWLARRNQPGFTDWAALDAWIREDPRHGRAYFRNIREDQRIIEEGDSEIAPGALPKVVSLKQPKAGFR